MPIPDDVSDMDIEAPDPRDIEWSFEVVWLKDGSVACKRSGSFLDPERESWSKLPNEMIGFMAMMKDMVERG